MRSLSSPADLTPASVPSWFSEGAADRASSLAGVIAVVPRSNQPALTLRLNSTMNSPEVPRFSIVVPAYNEAAYIGPALQALLQQDFAEPYEIIVVDNDSTDRTGEIAASYGVTVVRETARGICQARQRGTIEARGEIVVSTDADTVPPRDWLTGIDRQFRCSGGIVAVAGPCQYENPSWWARLYPRLLFGAVDRVFAWTGHVLYISATNTAYRRSAFPGYDSTLTQGGDELDLLRRLRRRGRVVWDSSNIVTTSARRLQQGLLYTFFVSLLTFYLLAYLLNRVSSRQILGMAPVFRQERRAQQRQRSGRGSSPAIHARLPPRSRTLQSTSDALLRVLWPERLTWRAVLVWALFVPMWAGLASIGVAAEVDSLLRFWTRR